MLAADAAAGLDAEPQDLGPQLLHPLPHPRLISAVEDQGMEVAIAGVKHIRHRQAKALAELPDRPHHRRQGTARHHAVLEVVAGKAPAQG